MRTGTLLAITCGALISSACQPAAEPRASSDPATNPTPSNAAVTDKREYFCGDLRVSADFHGTGPVRLRFDGRELTLPHIASGSGARYADEMGNEFWSKGDEAMFTLSGQPMRKCASANTPAS
jgi:membrane-bound inhibitor of C-type lysozyme